MELGDIIKKSKDIGLNGIALTDHNEIRGAAKAVEYSTDDFLVVPGIEISALEGHVIGLGLTEIVPSGLPCSETVELIHDLNGVAVAAHPYDSVRQAMGDLCFRLDFDAIEINGGSILGNGRARAVAAEHRRTLVGGSDAHVLDGIGLIYTEFELGDSLGVEDILEAIRSGRCRPVQRKAGATQKFEVIKNKIKKRF